jgi:hypothetical protein
LPITHRLLQVLVGPATPSVATLGRWTHQAALRAADLLGALELNNSVAELSALNPAA